MEDHIPEGASPFDSTPRCALSAAESPPVEIEQLATLASAEHEIDVVYALHLAVYR